MVIMLYRTFYGINLSGLWSLKCRVVTWIIVGITLLVVFWNINVFYHSVVRWEHEIEHPNLMIIEQKIRLLNLLEIEHEIALPNLLENEHEITQPNLIQILKYIILERNVLSRQLNQARRHVGQLHCENTKGKVNLQGGWCKNASTEKGGEHMTDLGLIKGLSKFLKNKTVSSFGDGPGAYKREILKLGEVNSYEAYDGAPFCEETSAGSVKFMDLTIPQYGIPLYDWIISLEVAEHIPLQYGRIYLDNIFRHAKDGIILSWAGPGQTGLSHINNRPLDYVVNIMDKNGFIIDKESSKVLQESSTFAWLKRNLNVFRKKNRDSDKIINSLFL